MIKQSLIFRPTGETACVFHIEGFDRGGGVVLKMSPVAWELAYEDKLTALHRHASQLSLANGISEIVKFTLDAMEYALGFDFADITVPTGNFLRMAGYRGSAQPIIDAPLNGRGITVKAANTKGAIRIKDTRKEPLYLDERGFDWKGSSRSELAQERRYAREP